MLNILKSETQFGDNNTENVGYVYWTITKQWCNQLSSDPINCQNCADKQYTLLSYDFLRLHCLSK